MLFAVYNPSLIFFGQAFHPMTLTTWAVLVFFGIMSSTILVLTLIPSQYFVSRLLGWDSKKIIMGMFSTLFVTFFILTTFFPQTSPLQDGTQEVLPAFDELALLYSAYILFYITVVFFAVKKHETFKRLYLAVIIFMILASVCTAVITIGQNARTVFLDDDTDLSFGSKRNIIVILADSLQGSSTEAVFNLHPELKNKFPGFVAYTKAITPFPFTTFSLQAILSGEIYMYDASVIEHFRSLQMALDDSFVMDAKNNGYNVTSVMLLPAFGKDDTYQIRNVPLFLAGIERLLNILDLGALRILRTRLVGNITLNTDLLWLKRESFEILERISKESIGEHENRLIFFHDFFPHAPIARWQRENGNIISELSHTPEAYLDEIRFYFEQLAKLIENLKELGIYNDAMLIIVADHGHPDIPPSELTNFSMRERGFWSFPVDLYNPVVMLKLPNAPLLPLEISHDFTSNTIVRELVNTMLNENDFSVFNMMLKTAPIALIDRSYGAHNHLTSESHVLVQLEGGIHNLPALMNDMRHAAAMLSFTKLELNIGTPISRVNTYGDFMIEETGAWIHGRSGTVALDVSNIPPNEDAAIIIRLSPLVNEIHPLQRIFINVSGVDLPYVELTQREDTDVRITIPREFIKENGSQIFLRFDTPDSVTPGSIGVGDWEYSAVSIFVKNFRLENANLLEGDIRNLSIDIRPVIDFTRLEINVETPASEINTFGGFNNEGTGARIHGTTGTAALDISNTASDEDAVIIVRLIPMVNELHPLQRVFISANGVDLYYVELTQPEDIDVRIIIPREIIKHNGQILLRFDTPDSITPGSIGVGDWEYTAVSIFVNSFKLENVN